ncbi:MAG: zinc ribbon domain-containing protein [Desulfovibrionaceae bacterium]|nr:zinc ribbon domain-containing protein [Desulfovibrionaceae bacterium]
MPIYEYQCTQCQHVFEEWLHRADEMTNAQTCPKCGGQAQHILSQTSFILKGGGWYVDDYGYRKNVKDDGKAGAEGNAAPAAVAEKPAANPAAAPAASPAAAPQPKPLSPLGAPKTSFS